MALNTLFEIVLDTLKKQYGEEFEKLDSNAKKAVIMTYVQELFAREPKIKEAIAESTYLELAF